MYHGDHLCRTCESDVRGLRPGIVASYATTALALLSVAAPLMVLKGIIAIRDYTWLPLLAAAVVLLGPLLVLIAKRLHNKIHLSLVSTNAALVPLLLLSVPGSAPTVGDFLGILAFVCELAGLVLAVGAWQSDDGSALELLLTFFAPMLWAVCLLAIIPMVSY